MPSSHGSAVETDSQRGIRVLLVDDERNLRESCTSVLVQDGYEVRSCGSGNEARALIERDVFDVVLVDTNMSQVPGMELLSAALQSCPDTRVILMTGNPSVQANIDALNAGAWDYLAKPFTADHLKLLVGRARHEIVQSLSPSRARRAPPTGDLEESYSLLGSSPAFMSIVMLARKVARTGASVFLTGESGTGKEMIAQFLHHNSRRRAKPMVAINCAALPEALLESEMFGHMKGSFTGATRDKAGLLEIAAQSTLFLDELTEMPLPIQAKLLRVLQDGSVRRVGSETVNAKVDVRFIAATNREPREAIREGVLRSDLYFRLGVVPIRVPPLRERSEDIPQLAEYFLRKYWAVHREPGSARPTLSDAAIAFLKERKWPGNVRELQNVMEHAVVLLEPGAVVEPSDFVASLDGTAGGCGRPPLGDWGEMEWSEVEYHHARDQVLGAFEQAYITSVLRRAGFNMSKAAKMAGVDRTTLYRLMEKHGLERETHLRD